MMSFSHSSSQLLMPGLHQANSLMGGRFVPRTRKNLSNAVTCEASLIETAKKLECLSKSEIQALATKSVSYFNQMAKSKASVNPHSWEESLDQAYEVLNQASVGGEAAFKPEYLLPRSRLLRTYHSPLLMATRGFKTKRAHGVTTDKPFTGMNPNNENQNMEAEGLKDLMQQLNLNKSEKEKVSIALAAYSSGFMHGKESDGATFNQVLAHSKGGGGAAGSGEKRRWFEWSRIHNFASILIIIAILISLGQIFNVSASIRFNKGNNEIAPEDVEVTFDDVKGCDEAKQELQEVVEFLMNPDKFSSLGGRLPKGCLLVGPPGTGKTLLARAVAGQAGVPFFHASGSEFDEVLVGQGARRVRDLFKAAKTRAPCVIFIDEIDSVGSKRTSSVLHPYANQTINQLLSEMDGFLSNEGVVVLGATNRAEDLDKALLRPGRFDTQVTVPNPDIKGRREILQLYLAKIKHDDSVDLEKLAKMTVGFSGADLQNIVNTAAIRAAVDGKEWVSMAEFEYSHDKHVLGTDWKSRVREKKDLEITAYHEAGHTLVAYFTQDSDPIHKVTIVAKGESGGHTAFLPETDTWHVTKAKFMAKMDVAMGGRAAEEIIYGKDKVTGGAGSDLESATGIAMGMVKNLGMSDKIGLRVFPGNKELSPGTGDLIDAEVSHILSESYKRASNILSTHRKELDLIADALLIFETLDVGEIKLIIETKKPLQHRLPPHQSKLGFNVPTAQGSSTKPAEPIGTRPVGGSGIITS